MAEETNSTKLFTLAEVAKHNTNRSTWLCIHNSVYDVTEFLNEVRLNIYWYTSISLRSKSNYVILTSGVSYLSNKYQII